MLQFATQDTPEMKAWVANPEDPETFRQSQLDPSEQEPHPEIVQLHTDLLALRRTDPILSRRDCRVDGAVLGQSCFVLRYLTSSREDRLLLINFGVGLDLPHLPEPLTAPPAGCEWRVQWSSEWPQYGGCGSYAPDRFGAWHVTGESTQLLVPVKTSAPFNPESPKSGLTGSDSN